MQKNEKGETPLHVAAIHGDVKKVKLLISQVGVIGMAISMFLVGGHLVIAWGAAQWICSLFTKYLY